MRDAPQGYTHLEDAPAKWGRTRVWWYGEVREGHLIGYEIPGLRGTYLRDEEVAAYLAPRPKESGTSSDSSRVG